MKSPSQLHSMAALAHFSLDEYDKAIESAQRALPRTKDPEESAGLKSFINQVKAVKKKAESTPKSNP